MNDLREQYTKLLAGTSRHGHLKVTTDADLFKVEVIFPYKMAAAEEKVSEQEQNEILTSD